MANTYLTRTPSSAGNRKTFTLSFWIKRGVLSSQQHIAYASGYTEIRFTSDDKTMFRNAGGNFGLSDAVFRDTSAWYHIVYAIDTTQATESNRIKLYVNGEQFTVTTFPTLNFDFAWNNNLEHQIGASAGAEFFDGSMAHFHNIDGTAYDATAFGEYDANGVWKIKTSPSVTYGTNGFFILKDGNSVTDQSGNSNNFTVGGGTLTKTEDNPSNVFCTMNPLDKSGGTVTTFLNGNTTTMHNAGNNGAVTAARSTLGYSSGKWYWETKCIATGGDVRTGIISMSSSDYVTNTNPYYNNECYNYKQTGQKGSSGDTNVSYGATYTAGDIIGIAHDADNGSLTFYKNGVSQGVAFSGLNTSLFWGAFSTEYNQGKYSYNFGNGYFGTTAVASAGTNASGNGIFEFNVPTGYTALSTKGLNL
ncbi:SPRY domain-containing protein [Pelagibacter phage Greip EXVC021P]|nr:SPRY domain-containing protein [Pelagibacter phage Greip EXVC021P]